MTSNNVAPLKTLNEEWLASYAAGGLSNAKRLLIACQAAIEPRLAAFLGELDQIGGNFLETAKGENLSDGFLANVMNALDNQVEPKTNTAIPSPKSDMAAWVPTPLRNFIDQANLGLKWKNAGPGVQRVPLAEDDGEMLYLLKAKPGLKVPMHSHRGEEWTLLLQGGYHVGDQGFVRGDLHQENENCTHQPIIDDDGEACISLVAVEGRLKFSDPLVKIFQPLIGI